MKAIHITASVGRGSFGLGAVVLSLAREQRRHGIEAAVWSTDEPDDLDWASESSGLARSALRAFPAYGPRRLAYSRSMERAAVAHQGQRPTVVHQHSLWTAVSRATRVLRERHHVSTVVAAHGALQQWALGRSRFRKAFASLLYEHVNLHSASCLHALSPMEVSDYRDFGLRGPVAIVPNGVSAEWVASKGDGKRFRERFAIADGTRVMLFLSRITPKKGLRLLLHAMNENRELFSDWLLVVAGVDEFGHQDDIRKLAAALGLTHRIAFVGPLFDQQKRDAFSAAEVFVLPSFSEGAPMVVLEALGAGIPVLATQASPWQDLLRYECGWWVPPTLQRVSEALGEVLVLGTRDLSRMGVNGQALVVSRYQWEKSAEMTLQLYAWLVGERERPDFVVVD
ncbi:MAG: glycosyltransferase [Gemmatimonadaceae bacterium]